jgi:hypothetical protein
MAESATLDQLKAYHRLLLTERGRRKPDDIAFFDRDDAIGELMERLDDMAQKLRAAPDWVEPDPIENARNVDRWFRERFG